MNYPNHDTPFIVFGLKDASARPVGFPIILGKSRKFTAERRFGYFGEAFMETKETVALNSFDKELLTHLGYNSLDEYLKEPYNKGLSLDDEKDIIFWSDFQPRWEAITPIFNKIDWNICQQRKNKLLGDY